MLYAITAKPATAASVNRLQMDRPLGSAIDLTNNPKQSISQGVFIAEGWKNRRGESIRFKASNGFCASIKHLPPLTGELSKAVEKGRALDLLDEEAFVMSAREILSNRRASVSLAFECGGMSYVATVSYFSDGRLAEIFLTSHKVGSDTDAAARDSAVVASIALQHGTPIETLRHALLRDARGVASSPLGMALDLLAGAP